MTPTLKRPKIYKKDLLLTLLFDLISDQMFRELLHK